MAKTKVLILVLVATWLEAYFFSAIGGVFSGMNLALMTLAIVSLKYDRKTVLLASWWAGLWLDIASSNLFGLRMLLFTGLAYGLTLLKRWRIELGRPLMLFGVIVAVSLVYNLALLVGFWLARRQLIFQLNYLTTWLWAAVLAAMLGVVLAPKFGRARRSY